MPNEINVALSTSASSLEDDAAVGYSTRVFDALDDLQQVRSFWESWQHHPNSDIDQFCLLCRLHRNERKPHVIVVYDRHEPRAILAGWLEDGEIAPNIGYMRPIRFAVKRLAVLYQGLLGHVDEAVTAALFRSLQASLKNGEADVVEFYQLNEDSPLLQKALAEVPRMWRDGEPAWSTHWELTLPQEPGGLVQNMKSKHRSWITRKTRELEVAFPKRVTYRSFSPGSGVESLCEELEQVARLTYQRGLGEGFMDNSEHRERFGLFDRRRALRAWALCIDDKPRAFCLGYVYGNTFHFSETGYDAALRSHEIGTLIFLHMTNELIKEGIAKFNFGFGDAYYKQRFGDRSWKEGTLRLYARGFKGLMTRACVGAVGTVAATIRTVSQRLGIFNKLKTAWRKRLAAKATAKAEGQ